MIDKKTKKTIEFVENDENFVKLLAMNIGCHYSKANVRTYNLNRNKSAVQGEAGVFAWVHKEGTDCFWVTTRKTWVEKAKALMLAGRGKSITGCFPRDSQQADDSVCFDTNDDYSKTVKVLTLIFQTC